MNPEKRVKVLPAESRELLIDVHATLSAGQFEIFKECLYKFKSSNKPHPDMVVETMLKAFFNANMRMADANTAQMSKRVEGYET